MTFRDYFCLATGADRSDPQAGPFPYQERLATSAEWPARIEIPTGLGKTLAVVVAWLWRRRPDSPNREQTPRRLVYCLPMRVLVEQTRDVISGVLQRLGLSTRVVVLMGGVDDDGEWDTRPEDDAIVIGTQDMLLSRALNRGYGMSRYRWPLHFGLLNTDCLWVIDEVQLVGSGVATTTQLQALRRKLGTVAPTRTSWMSATLDEEWLRTVDVEAEDVGDVLSLEDTDARNPVVHKRTRAGKALGRAQAKVGDVRGLANEVAAAHRAGTRTLVIANTVDRARDLFVALRKAKTPASVVLLHSRFRRAERDANLERALAQPEPAGTIVVSTQVIEAGVDLTSATLFTEVAPWSSLVQRFGRCNRRGEDEGARIFWVALPDDPKEQAKVHKPYALANLLASEEALAGLEDAGPSSLPARPMELEQGLVLRRRDLLDLFDTTPDLSGNDVDVSRFIRDADDHDVRLCWRNFDGEPGREQPTPRRDELCSAPIGVARDWEKQGRALWSWNPLRARWERPARLFPGLTLLLPAKGGGYDPEIGLDPKGDRAVPVVKATHVDLRSEDREYDGEPLSEWSRWYTLREHSEDVAADAEQIVAALALPAVLRDAVVTAGRWHDAGKAHRVWQEAARRLGADPPAEAVAKSQAAGKRITYEGRPGFRHELASALLALQHGQPDLVCFLIACHHGKVRVSIRSLPTERAPTNGATGEDPTIRYARGVWEGDILPPVDLGNGLTVPQTALTLSYMELGDDPVTGPSWMARVLALRDAPDLGPFRLAFLEGLVKCADERASQRASRAGGTS